MSDVSVGARRCDGVCWVCGGRGCVTLDGDICFGESLCVHDEKSGRQ